MSCPNQLNQRSKDQKRNNQKADFWEPFFEALPFMEAEENHHGQEVHHSFQNDMETTDINNSTSTLQNKHRSGGSGYFVSEKALDKLEKKPDFGNGGRMEIEHHDQEDDELMILDGPRKPLVEAEPEEHGAAINEVQETNPVLEQEDETPARSEIAKVTAGRRESLRVQPRVNYCDWEEEEESPPAKGQPKSSKNKTSPKKTSDHVVEEEIQGIQIDQNRLSHEGEVNDEIAHMTKSAQYSPVVEQKANMEPLATNQETANKAHEPMAKRAKLTNGNELVKKTRTKTVNDAIEDRQIEEIREVKQELKVEVVENEESTGNDDRAPRTNSVPAAADNSVTTGNIGVRDEHSEPILPMEIKDEDDDDIIFDCFIPKSSNQLPSPKRGRLQFRQSASLIRAPGPDAEVKNEMPVQQVKREFEEDADLEVLSASISKYGNQEQGSQRTGRLEDRAGTLDTKKEALPTVEAKTELASLEPKRSNDFADWTVEQMADWIVGAAKWVEGREVIIREQINGENMEDLADAQFLIGLNIASGPMQRVRRAAQLMLDRVEYYFN